MTTGKGDCAVCKVVGVLVALGAINWGVVGLLGVDVVGQLLGPMSTLTRVVYGIIGAAGLLKLVSLVKCCPCQKGTCSTK